ncbi:MAG: hypothetical protein F6K00_32940 [Leptolyngbya sp. SIOISBB]|nr:hypothetical protein [Leptolyngbya sp. SIOISBB]
MNSLARRHAVLSRSALFLMLGTLGGCLGPVIILWGYPFPQDSPSQTFITQPEFLTFLFLTSVYTSISTLLAFPLWRSLRFLKGYMKGHQVEVMVILTAMLFLFFAPTLLGRLIAFPFLDPQPFDLEHLRVKIIALILVGTIAIAPAAIGTLILPNVARRDIQASRLLLPDRADDLVAIQKYLRYRQLMQQYLYSSGAIVGLITLIAGALRNVRLAVGLTETQFPQSVIITFGLYWSAILALFYTIGQLALLECGQHLRDDIYPLNSLTSLMNKTEQRRGLNEILHLNASVEQNIRNAIAILAPLLTGLIANLLSIESP